jgi:hypothetical protein
MSALLNKWDMICFGAEERENKQGLIGLARGTHWKGGRWRSATREIRPCGLTGS